MERLKQTACCEQLLTVGACVQVLHSLSCVCMCMCMCVCPFVCLLPLEPIILTGFPKAFLEFGLVGKSYGVNPLFK